MSQAARRAQKIKAERRKHQRGNGIKPAKEISNKTIRNLDDLVGSSDQDVSGVAEGIRARLDKASAESEMLASSLDKQMDEALERRDIDSQLIERKRRLGLAEG